MKVLFIFIPEDCGDPVFMNDSNGQPVRLNLLSSADEISLQLKLQQEKAYPWDNGWVRIADARSRFLFHGLYEPTREGGSIREDLAAAEGIYAAVHAERENRTYADIKNSMSRLAAPKTVLFKHFSRTASDLMWSNLLKALWHESQGAGFGKFGDQVFTAFQTSGYLNAVVIAKHKITNLLVSIDVDLQGLRESGYSAKYWEEVTKIYTKESLDRILQEVRYYLHDWLKSALPQEDSRHVPPVLALSDLIREDGSIPDQRVAAVFAHLGASEDSEVLEGSHMEAFHVWFATLVERLEKLRIQIINGEVR